MRVSFLNEKRQFRGVRQRKKRKGRNLSLGRKAPHF